LFDGYLDKMSLCSMFLFVSFKRTFGLHDDYVPQKSEKTVNVSCAKCKNLLKSFAAIFQERRDDWRIVCRLYRGPFLIIEFLFLWGINIYGWRSSGVNHVLIFEMDPRNHLSEQHIIEMAAIFGVIWSISVLSFLYSSELSIPAYVNPFVLVLLMLAFLFNPTKTFRHEARFWALRVLVGII
jgi:hypothetical protein